MDGNRVPPNPTRRTFLGIGLVLLVMTVASVAAMALPLSSAESIGGTGAGEGDVGQIKIYLRALVEGTFGGLALVLLLGSLTSFGFAAFQRRARS